jgi:hypothetical protein
MAPGTADELLQRVYRHLLYIGQVPARTGRTNGHRNRSIRALLGKVITRNSVVFVGLDNLNKFNQKSTE